MGIANDLELLTKIENIYTLVRKCAERSAWDVLEEMLTRVTSHIEQEETATILAILTATGLSTIRSSLTKREPFADRARELLVERHGAIDAGRHLAGLC
jgi:hypothetical protein